MLLFLIFSAGFLFIFGVLLLLSPKTVQDISAATNKALFTLEDRIPKLRRPLGIFLLLSVIYLWYLIFHILL